MLGHPDRATENFETVVRLQPQAWQAWNNLGANYLTLGRSAAAEQAFRKAVALAPHATSAAVNLASALLREGNEMQAFRALDQAHQRAPEDAQVQRAWLALAAAIATEAGKEIDRGQYRPAYTKLLLVKSPLQKQASWNNLIGYAEFKLNMPDHARYHLQAALELDPENEDYLLDAGEFLASRHAYRQAGEFFAIGAKRMPHSRRVRFGVAITDMLQDRRQEAIQELEQLRSEYPDWEPVYRALGECYEDAGSWPALIALGRSLQSKNPANASGWYFEGAGEERLSMQNGTPASAAISPLRRAVALAPHSSRYHFELGKAYAESKQPRDAVRELQESIRLDPGQERAHYVLARVYRELGEAKLAEREFQVHSSIKERGRKEAYAAMLALKQRVPVNSREDSAQ